MHQTRGRGEGALSPGLFPGFRAAGKIELFILARPLISSIPIVGSATSGHGMLSVLAVAMMP